MIREDGTMTGDSRPIIVDNQRNPVFPFRSVDVFVNNVMGNLSKDGSWIPYLYNKNVYIMLTFTDGKCVR